MSLDTLRERLDNTKQLAAWIASATEKAAEFPSDVVQKVIQDYAAQYEEQLPALLELAEAASTERQGLADQAEELDTHKAEVEAKIDEYRLRHVIGELSEDEFAEREEEARGSIDEEALTSARAQIENIDELLSEVGEVQNQVSSLLGSSAPAAPAEEAGPELSDLEVLEESSAEEAEEDVAVASADPVSEDELGEAAYAAGGEDLSEDEWEVDAVASPGSLGPESLSMDESGVESLDVLPGADSQISEVEELDIQSAEASDAAEGTAEAVMELADSDPEMEAADAGGEGPRLSVTMPGTPGPELYPFTGEVMSLGRGRNNDIQIKNDGKISRYHCRIFRRGDEFIVEDNKSSNGTLVDGKLVTRQPLTGGELVQIGETRVEFFAR